MISLIHQSHSSLVLTDLATGDFASVVVWKLNGPVVSCPDVLLGLPALSTDIGLYTEFVLVGLSGLAGDVAEEAMEPNLPTGKFSTIGDNALGSNTAFLGEVMTPSKPRPAV